MPLGHSFATVLIEEREALEQVADPPSDDTLHSVGGHIVGYQKCQIEVGRGRCWVCGIRVAVGGRGRQVVRGPAGYAERWAEI